MRSLSPPLLSPLTRDTELKTLEECSISVVAISLTHQGGVPDLKQGTWSKDFDGVTSAEGSYRKEANRVTFSIVTEAENTAFDLEA